MTEQEFNRIQALVEKGSWPKGSMYKAMLQLLLKQPGRTLQKADYRMINMAETQSKTHAKSLRRAESKHNKNRKRQARQLAAMRIDR